MSPASPDPDRTRRRKDWCRNSEWTPLAREKFFLRLATVRHRSKYLRRKAQYLLDDNPAAACELLALAAAEAAGEQESRVQQMIEYAAIVTSRRCLDRYPDVAARLAVLDEKLLDPVQRFFYHAARAELASKAENPGQATLDARSALAAHRHFADSERQFPEVALAGVAAKKFYARLYLLAGKSLAG